MSEARTRFHQKIISKTAAILLVSSFFFSCGTLTPRRPVADYSRLVELMRLEDRFMPVYPFNDFVNQFDPKGHKSNLAYLNKRTDLIRKIRRDLGGERLQWKLDDFEQRLLYVPETRKDYANLYENYCHEVIGFILDETGFDNPFADIRTLNQPKPEIPPHKGVSVFLVHNLAREYIGTYAFFNEIHQKEVKISLRGKIFIGEIGSYSSVLELQDDGTVIFAQNPFTIWQNSAELPYNALIVPIEETLHIALRQNTEDAIREQVAALETKTHRDVKQVVDHWISVEEAMVGGLVQVFFPRVASRYLTGFPREEIEQSLQSKSRMDRYRYLQKGIEVVQTMGFEAAIGIYRQNPELFRDMVVSGSERSSSL